MATFKAEVQQHQKRKDGTYPVSIRVTHNRKNARIATGLYVTERQINKKTFEIKDQFVLARTNQTIVEYRERLLSLGTSELLAMPISQLKSFLTASAGRLDYLAYCNDLVASDPIKYGCLKQVIVLIGEMGIKSMTPEDVTTQFVNRFREYIDNKVWMPEHYAKQRKVHREPRKYKASTKNNLISALSMSFNKMCQDYNTDFVKVIKHTPTFTKYEKEETKKKTLKKEDLLKFIKYKPQTDAQELAKDLCLLSFGLCGINLKDLFVMEKHCYLEEYNRIFYRRSKTGIVSSVVIPKQVQALFEKYRSKKGKYLFTFRDLGYARYGRGTVDSALERISEALGIETITPYWFRHTWSSYARNKCGATKDDVDMALAHSSKNKMADVYIQTDWAIVDQIAQKVQDYVYK